MIYLFLDNPQLGAAILGVLILAISLHEMAHAWMALRCGDDTAAREGRLTLNPAVHFDPVGILFILFATFGWGRPVPVNPYNLRDIRRDSMLISIAGPVSNILQAIAFALLFRLLFLQPVHQLIGTSVAETCLLIFVWGVRINLALAFFNMIPLFPLDGEKVFMGLVSHEYALKMEEFRRYGIMVLFLLLMSGAFLGGKSILHIYFELTSYPLGNLLLGI